MTKDVGIEGLQKPVERVHGSSAFWLKAELVRGTFQDKPMRNGIFQVFEIEGHPALPVTMHGQRPLEEARIEGSLRFASAADRICLGCCPWAIVEKYKNLLGTRRLINTLSN